VWRTIARGEVLDLPNFGLETVHHVHADDIAALFMAAIGNREASLGQSFHSVSPRALTLRGYAEAMYQWFGQEPKLQFLPFADWAKGKDPGEANATWEHIARSPNCSMEKAERLLGYRPAYSSIRAVTESVQWLIEQGKLTLA
jgi:nucleoside-diphosphate-sugar epimerase